MVGKYIDLIDAYKSLNEALKHAGISLRTKVKIRYIDSEDMESQGLDQLEGVDAILVPGGFGERGIEGKIKTVQYARENRIPYLGICLGMQVAVIEYARNVAGLPHAHSTEFDSESPDPVIALITEWIDEDGSKQSRADDSDLGGSMRLGAQKSTLVDGSTTQQCYQTNEINERHRHRYEFNNRYLEQFKTAGMNPSGVNPDSGLVEILELDNHPWFVGVQFHPELKSTVEKPSPIFMSFVAACKNLKVSDLKKSASVNA